MNWTIRFMKGVLIGTGFILPGVSGGALAAIFGLYERIISFMAHLTKDFKKNLFFFLPVGLGMLAGIVILSYPLGFFLEHFLGPTMWFFIGAILGTFPALWREAGKKGREGRHFVILIVAAVGAFAFLLYGVKLFQGNVPINQLTWFFVGALIALGVLVPGLSPSNFLLYMGLYGPMVDAFKRLDLLVLVLIAAGGLICMLAFSKVMDMLFAKVYAGLFHVIIGIVAASTAMIVPLNYSYRGINLVVCVITCIGGTALGYWMSGLEEKYKH